MKNNPYSLLFGKEPPQVIDREEELDSVISSFDADIPVQQVYMITGVRGSGKTVLMTEVSKRLSEQERWTVIELNPERNLLEDLLTKLCSDSILEKIFSSSKINLSFFGIGINISGSPPVTNIETALAKMLESLKKKKKRVLITIDEAVSTPSMREFVHSYQIFIRKDLPVFLLMTGLYQNIDVLQNEKGLTFLYRAPKITLRPLSVRTIAVNYMKTFRLKESEAKEMAAFTMGYSFAFQVLGHLTWEQDGRYKDVLDDFRRYLADYAYDKIWSELSSQDRTVLMGVASSPSEKIADIRGELQMDTNHFNPYRKRLIQRGVLDGSRYGCLFFVLPFFREYVLENG